MKPPNILVYSSEVDCIKRLYEAVRWCLSPNKYTLYKVSLEQITNAPWIDNTRLLILHGKCSYPSQLNKYLNKGGQILSVGSQFLPSQFDGNIIDKDSIGSAGNIPPLAKIRILPLNGLFLSLEDIVRDENGELLREILFHILSQHFKIEVAQGVPSPSITTGYLFQDKGDVEGVFHIGDNIICPPYNFKIVSDLNFDFENDTIPIVSNVSDSCEFNFEHYKRHLRTRYLGRRVFYFDVIGSTMDLFKGKPLGHGVTVIAGQQNQGQGRGGNVWLSPKGCAMFTFQIFIPQKSQLGSKPSFIQHLSIIAVISGIRSLPGFSELDIRIKWPNDIYFGKSIKLGGIIALGSSDGKNFVFTIGCGVNVANSFPTSSLNDCVKQHNVEFNKDLPKLTPEQVIAVTLNQVEDLLAKVQDSGVAAVLPMYYEYWIHHDQQVTIKHRENNRPDVTGKIIGIEESGYLKVQLPDGKIHMVFDDGNSFDLTQGLIFPK